MSKINIKVQVTQLSGERFWQPDTPIPTQLQISINVNILGIEKKSGVTLEAPFVFTINFTPSIAQISIKGKTQATGESKEISKILEEHKKQKKPPTMLIQAISNAGMADAILLSKTLGIPPPLPSIAPTAEKVQQKSSIKYTA